MLFDHCVPRPLGPLLIGHTVQTTYRMGWADKGNGELLSLAATAFEVFVTTDRRMKSQQNLSTLPIPVVVLLAVSSDVDALKPLVPELLRVLGEDLRCRVYAVGI